MDFFVCVLCVFLRIAICSNLFPTSQSLEPTTNPLKALITTVYSHQYSTEDARDGTTRSRENTEMLSTDVTDVTTQYEHILPKPTMKLLDVSQPNTPTVDVSNTFVIITMEGIPSFVSNVYIAATQNTTRRRREPANFISEPVSYLVANLTRDDIINTANFTIGDGEIYGGYLNKRLEDGGIYLLIIGHANCATEVCVVAWSNPVTFKAPKAPVAKDSSTAIVLGVLLGIVVVIVCLFIAVLLWKKRRFRPKQSSDEETAKEGKVNKGFSHEDEFEEIEMNDVLHADIRSYKWSIFWSDLKLTKRVLGQGYFGNIRLGGIRIQDKWIKSAIDILQSDAMDYDNKKTEMYQEMKTMTRIDPHVNVINVLGICEHKGTVYSALEFAPNGSLRQFLRENRKDPTSTNKGSYQTLADQTLMSNLNSEQLLNIAMGVSKGMEYLATYGIIHRDLSARNILIGKNITPKVSNYAKAHSTTEPKRNPLRWMAIESLAMRIYTSKSNTWSYGVLLWEIATLGGTPYPEMESRFLNFQLNNGYRMPKPENCGIDMYALMRNCWKEEPDSRPSFKQIVDALTQLSTQPKIHISTRYRSSGLHSNNNSQRQNQTEILGISTFVPIHPQRDDS